MAKKKLKGTMTLELIDSSTEEVLESLPSLRIMSIRFQVIFPERMHPMM